MKGRITSLFLCILMLVSVLASCKDDKNPPAESDGNKKTGNVIYIAVIDAKEASGAYSLFKE